MTVLFGIVRTKIVALLLGPAGLGILGIYNSILEFAKNVAGMGISGSSVRQVAESLASGDPIRSARTILCVRWVALVLGLFGAAAVALGCWPISMLSFGNASQSKPVALLSIAVFFGTISAGQIGLIQGSRRVSDLAKCTVAGSALGLVLGLLLLYHFRRSGIPLFLVVTAAAATLASWFYARTIRTQRVIPNWNEMRGEALELLKLGFAFSASAIMSVGAAYVVRVIVLRRLGEEAAGFYQAAWTIGGLYAGFILQAMGTDFFPRLTAVARDNEACNRMVNEQTEVGLLIAIPGLLATLTFAPLVIQLFYSNKFGPAIDLLRWNCLALLLRVASWPIGFIMLAKGERKIFMVTEFFSGAAYVGLVWAGLHFFGLIGTGIGFLAVYVLYLIPVFAIGHHLSGFRWSRQNWHVALIAAPLIIGVFLIGSLLPVYIAVPIGTAATLAACYFCLRTILCLVSPDRLPTLIAKAAIWLKLTPRKNKD
jgi:PST family polysaccharide transporter